MIVYIVTAYIVLVILLHVKKSRLPGSKEAKKVAFFHPFWYSKSNIVMTEEADKKCSGP